MSDTAIILYGSRARGENREGADVDLLAAAPFGGLGKPSDVYGVSLHLYPQPWLLEEAHVGNLFVYHVAFEGVALLDPARFLPRLRDSFEIRDSYFDEIKVADRVVRALLETDWGFDNMLRRRYYWGIRTILIGRSADAGGPVFSSRELELFSGIGGLARHIDGRSTEPFSACARIGAAVLDRWGVPAADLAQPDVLKWLESSPGVGQDTIRLIETREAVDSEGLRFYL